MHKSLRKSLLARLVFDFTLRKGRAVCLAVIPPLPDSLDEERGRQVESSADLLAATILQLDERVAQLGSRVEELERSASVPQSTERPAV